MVYPQIRGCSDNVGVMRHWLPRSPSGRAIKFSSLSTLICLFVSLCLSPRCQKRTSILSQNSYKNIILWTSQADTIIEDIRQKLTEFWRMNNKSLLNEWLRLTIWGEKLIWGQDMRAETIQRSSPSVEWTTEGHSWLRGRWQSTSPVTSDKKNDWTKGRGHCENWMVLQCGGRWEFFGACSYLVSFFYDS